MSVSGFKIVLSWVSLYLRNSVFYYFDFYVLCTVASKMKKKKTPTEFKSDFPCMCLFPKS